MRSRRWKVAGLLSAVAATALAGYLLLATADSEAPCAAQAGAIAFTSHRDGVSIRVVDDDGDRGVPLPNEGPPFHPAFSPSGETIAFGRDDDIYSIHCDGGSEAQLTEDPASDDDPAFSPDARQIAFTRDRGDGPDIYLMDAGGTGEIRLTDHPAPDYDPTFSPDGGEIAFTRGRPEGDVHVMDVDGGNETALTGNENEGRADPHEFGPTFSPDGDEMAFALDRHGGGDIYVMDRDGTDQRRLTSDPATSSDEDPAFSPDGERIAFTSYRGGSAASAEVVLMDSDGRHAEALTANHVFDGDPSWRR